MKHKRLVLKQSVKDFIDYTIIIGLFIFVLFISYQSITMGSRQQKMTEISGTYISQNK